MTYKQSIKILAAVAGLLASTAVTKASNVTIQDYTGPQTSEANNLVTGIWGPAWGWRGGPLGVGLEDNETEAVSYRVNASTVGVSAGTVRGQKWDMEAFAVNGSKLSVVGGYEFNAGYVDGRPGDLFIKLGGLGSFNPVSPIGAGGSYANGSNYDYVVDLSHGVGSGNGSSVSVNVYKLNANSVLNTTINDQLGSNPWTVNGQTATLYTSTTLKYTFDASAAQLGAVDPDFVGVNGLKGDSGAGQAPSASLPLAEYTDRHNILDIDINWLLALVAPGQQVGLSYTMECGNDQMKGMAQLVPDGGATLMLLGSGLSALCLVGRRYRK